MSQTDTHLGTNADRLHEVLKRFDARRSAARGGGDPRNPIATAVAEEPAESHEDFVRFSSVQEVSMRRFALGIVVTAAVMGLGTLMAFPVGAQQARACLHGADETPSERARRNEAVGYTRSVHNAQAGFIAVNSRYGQIDELQGVRPIPAGFEVQHAAQQKGYIFSVKDTTDQCRFTIFSDQIGIIYFAAPMG